jgi:hypothetical protein
MGLILTKTANSINKIIPFDVFVTDTHGKKSVNGTFLGKIPLTLFLPAAGFWGFRGPVRDFRGPVWDFICPHEVPVRSRNGTSEVPNGTSEVPETLDGRFIFWKN